MEGPSFVAARCWRAEWSEGASPVWLPHPAKKKMIPTKATVKATSFGRSASGMSVLTLPIILFLFLTVEPRRSFLYLSKDRGFAKPRSIAQLVVLTYFKWLEPRSR